MGGPNNGGRSARLAAWPTGSTETCFAEALSRSGCSLKRDEVLEALQARRDPWLFSG